MDRKIRYALGAACLAIAVPAYAQDQNSAPPWERAGQTRPQDGVMVVVTAPSKGPAKLDHIQPEVDGTQITVTKKSSITRLNQQPTVVDNNLQQLFARTPGLQVSEQGTPAQFNMNYRGLGNPQEAEFVLVLQDGIPISTDWIGFPTLYHVPLPQGISEIQLLRGGSSLIYGPNPAPAVNYVSKRPYAGEPVQGYTENLAGSDRLFSSYNAIEGAVGDVEFRGAYGHVQSDGQRDNAASKLDQADLYLAYRPSKSQLWYLDTHFYNVSAGDPGRITHQQFLTDPSYSPTPYNHNWVRRTSVTLGNQSDLGNGWKLDAKAWAAWQRLYNRTADNIAANGTYPATTTIADMNFRTQGLDVRAVKRFGRGNAITLGAVAYHDSAPFDEYRNPDLLVERGTVEGTPWLIQDRDSYYQAVFAEAVFRLPHRWHIVPSFRFEHEVLDIEESVKPAFLTRSLIDAHASRTVPLAGLGIGFDFGHQNETYFSVTQGYRPLRFYDVASPFSNVTADDIADPQKSLAWEAGVHGTPLNGLFYDVSLFWIDFRNRIETVTLNNTDTVNINSGNTRHRGFEGQVSYDLLAPRGSDLHLVAFGNISLLDAEFTASKLAGRVGNVPAYAPDVTAKFGLTLRRDKWFNFSVTGVHVSSQFWQDSNTGSGSGASFLPARIPAYTTVDIAGDVYLDRNFRLLGGISNIGDAAYYNRVWRNGIEPAPGRKFYLGAAVGF